MSYERNILYCNVLTVSQTYLYYWCHHVIEVSIISVGVNSVVSPLLILSYSDV